MSTDKHVSDEAFEAARKAWTDNYGDRDQLLRRALNAGLAVVLREHEARVAEARKRAWEAEHRAEEARAHLAQAREAANYEINKALGWRDRLAARVDELEDRVKTVADEAFGPFATASSTADDMLSEIEGGIFKQRQDGERWRRRAEALMRLLRRCREDLLNWQAEGPSDPDTSKLLTDLDSALSAPAQPEAWSAASVAAYDPSKDASAPGVTTVPFAPAPPEARRDERPEVGDVVEIRRFDEIEWSRGKVSEVSPPLMKVRLDRQPAQEVVIYIDGRTCRWRFLGEQHAQADAQATLTVDQKLGAIHASVNVVAARLGEALQQLDDIEEAVNAPRASVPTPQPAPFGPAAHSGLAEALPVVPEDRSHIERARKPSQPFPQPAPPDDDPYDGPDCTATEHQPHCRQYVAPQPATIADLNRIGASDGAGPMYADPQPAPLVQQPVGIDRAIAEAEAVLRDPQPASAEPGAVADAERGGRGYDGFTQMLSGKPVEWWRDGAVTREPPAQPAAPAQAERTGAAPAWNDKAWLDLWEAINEYAAACGGDTSTATVSVRRMRAVAAIEKAASARYGSALRAPPQPAAPDADRLTAGQEVAVLRLLNNVLDTLVLPDDWTLDAVVEALDYAIARREAGKGAP